MLNRDKNMGKKRVLIITYYFPPRPGVASLRLRGLAKYLPEFGWEPVILTAALPGTPDKRFHVVQTHYPGDATALLKKRWGLSSNKGFQEQVGIPIMTRERRNSISSKLTRFHRGIFIYPDDQKKWNPYAIKKGLKILQDGNVIALISSSGPATTHLIAKELKEKTGIPWIADLRDLWTQNHYYPYGMLRKWFERRLESLVLCMRNLYTRYLMGLIQMM
jgi:hypothetical protein